MLGANMEGVYSKRATAPYYGHVMVIPTIQVLCVYTPAYLLNAGAIPHGPRAHSWPPSDNDFKALVVQFLCVTRRWILRHGYWRLEDGCRPPRGTVQAVQVQEQLRKSSLATTSSKDM